MYGNRENLPGILNGTYEFVCSPTEIAKELFLYVEYIGHAFCSNQYALIRSRYSHYLLMYLVRGSAIVHTEQITYVAPAGHAFLIDTSRPHIYGCLQEMEALWIHFNGQNFAPLFSYLTRMNQQSPVFTLSRSPDFGIKLCALIDNFKRPEPEPEVMVSARLHELIGLLLVNCQTPEFSPIEQSIRYINTHYPEPLSLKRLAETAHLSISRFSTVFKQITDLSPYQYVINTRLHAACQYLNSSSLSVEEISAVIGFANPPAFINAFKKKYDITPHQFRKRARGYTMEDWSFHEK